MVDRDMLRQVMVNLCDNSAHALHGRPGVVTLRVDAAGDAVALEVADSGPGIDASLSDRLFEPYTTTRGVGEGMGLGLAISKKILLDHGGDLELVGSSPDGTTFRISLRSAPGVTP
jgi:two-component system C4-dicarboxylate transport sensor histidine kinase DctB